MKLTLILAGLLTFGLALPRASFAITGCTNANLTGTYDASITNANLMALVNPTTGGTGTGGGTSGGGTTGTSGTSTTTTVNPGGFGNNSASLSGAIPGLGRYFFDGNGNIVGLGMNNLNTTVGTYTVNTDCTATMKLNTGQSFAAVLADSGARVLFIESDSTSPGIVGELNLAENACVPSGSTGTPTNFAFTFFGATRATSSSGTTASAAATPAAAVGSISLDGQGGFTLRQWSASSGTVQTVNANGTYTIGQDCSIRFTFVTPAGGTTPTNLPANFRALLVNKSSGVLSVQPAASGDSLTGVFVNQ